MLGDVTVSPIDAAQRLRGAAVDGRLEALAEVHDLVSCALMDLVDSDRVDLLDLDRAGPVARQHALVPGDPASGWAPSGCGGWIWH